MKKEVKINSIIAVLLAVALSFSCLVGNSIAKEKVEQLNTSEIEAALKEAEAILIDQDKVRALPIAESENNGYWWNNQTVKEKKEYIKMIIEIAELEDQKLNVKRIVNQLDSLYVAKDNPLDIKLDISIERGFFQVTGIKKEVLE